jgi:hypothetical protein
MAHSDQSYQDLLLESKNLSHPGHCHGIRNESAQLPHRIQGLVRARSKGHELCLNAGTFPRLASRLFYYSYSVL